MEPLPHLPTPAWTPELEALFKTQGKLTNDPSGCIFWNGATFSHGGYGRFYVPSCEKGKIGTVYRAHRVAYAWKYGDSGDAVLDHICHDPMLCFDTTAYCEHRKCVNPEHLEPTTRGENVRRGIPGSPLWHPLGNSLKQICSQGHEFTPENTYINPRGERQCRQCLRDASNRYAAANREKVNARKRAARVKVVYDMRPCQHCGRPYQPVRSTSRYCSERDCVNSRQRENRASRIAQER